MKKENYNDWSNRETWIISLWLNNEPTTYELAREYAQASPEDLKEWIQSLKNNHDNTAGMFNDLLETALDRVDWRELADTFKEE